VNLSILFGISPLDTKLYVWWPFEFQETQLGVSWELYSEMDSHSQLVDHDGSLKQVPPLLCGEEGRKHLLGSLLSSPGSLHLLLANCVSRAEETFNDTLGRNLFEIL